MTHKKWQVKTIPVETTRDLATSVKVSAVTARILAGRGMVSVDECASFLAPSLSSMPDPFLLKGVQAAVERMMLARQQCESVCIYGDYDVDGISGTALLVSVLRFLGLSCNYFIPNRFDDGYGLNEEALLAIVDSGATLIVSVDCGITSLKEAAFCRKKGVDLIILDHHTPGEAIPDAIAVVNPLQPGCQYPFKLLAGVGVAFNFLVALRSRLRGEGAFSAGDEPDLREWLDLVALGTIADVVPLVGQNRLFAFYGLQKMHSNNRQGIVALKNVAGIKDEVACGQVGFRMAPRLNAAGRMESAVPGVELLLSENAGQCAMIAEELDAANTERQSVERTMLEQAVAMVENSAYPEVKSIVLASRDWHQGVVGIVASRIVERFHRPTILIAIDEQGNGKGSGRSISGFHLFDALKSCSALLERFGGHRYAAGIAIKAENVEAFTALFEAEAQKMLAGVELVPSLEVDLEVSPQEVNLSLAEELCRLEPFGAGNPEPVLMMRNVAVLDRRVVGDGHLKLRLSAGGYVFNAIAFRQSDYQTNGALDIAFFPETNRWNNSTSLQLRIKALRDAELS